MPSVSFFNEGTSYKLKHPRKTINWIKATIQSENHELQDLTFVFCNDTFLNGINVQFLNHNTFTDIITFDHSERKSDILGEIYISIPRVRANAKIFGATFEEELHRVLIHGVLHLIGYSDKTKRQKQTMRKKEDSYLSLR